MGRSFDFDISHQHIVGHINGYIFYFFTAIKIGRYTYNKRTNDFIEVKKLKSRERQENGKKEEVCNPASQIETTKNYPCDKAEEKEVTKLLEKLIAIQEDMIADYRQGFIPNALLEKQMEIYVCWIKDLWLISDWLLLNVQQTVFQLYTGRGQVY